jgi:nitrate/TMAO reductase-like tetraheme cytochrome c subunit
MKHPTRKFRSTKQYRARASLSCRRCHKDPDLLKAPVHAGLIGGEAEGRSAICTDCHSAHSISRVSGSRIFSTEEKYCLNCHARGFEMTFRNGESLLARADMSELKGSVHKSLFCSDCHFGFSSEDHPKRNFRTRRDYTLSSSEICRRCHFDKYTKTLESIHFTVLSQGNLKAPVCIDCHGGHAISRAAEDRTASARRCRTCHPDIYDVYAKSVHGSALMNGQNRDVPVCASCHRAHDITDSHAVEYHERIPQMCGGCHSDQSVMAKYGLSTDVLKTYLSDFHGVTLDFYKKQKADDVYRPAKPIAVCTDCHGVHNLSSTIGPGAAALKSNLLRRCQKCHPGATENFPDAWLSHYVPSMKKTPFVFIVDTAYKIFIPIMVIGLLLQILLHIWRYIVDR